MNTGKDMTLPSGIDRIRHAVPCNKNEGKSIGRLNALLFDNRLPMYLSGVQESQWVKIFSGHLYRSASIG